MTLNISQGEVSTTIEEINAQIATLTTWRDFLVTARQELGRQLLALPRQDGREHGLRLSITRIDRGLDFMSDKLPASLPLDDLMRGAGCMTWQGTLPETEQKLRELTELHDEAQALRDRVLKDAPAGTPITV